MITTAGEYLRNCRRPRLKDRRDECYLLGVMRRVLWFHREALEGRYPNCRTAALVFSVCTKTVIRDVGMMRKDFRLPLRFDNLANGYFYGEPPGNPFESIFRTVLVLPPPVEEGERSGYGVGARERQDGAHVAEYDPVRSAQEFLAGLSI